MLVRVLKSKLHRAAVTASHLEYSGSLTIDEDLMEAVGLLPYEVVLMGNLANGARGETYCIPGKRGSREIVLNGAMARLGTVGDRLVIMSFAWAEADEAPSIKPKAAMLGDDNQITEMLFS